MRNYNSLRDKYQRLFELIKSKDKDMDLVYALKSNNNIYIQRCGYGDEILYFVQEKVGKTLTFNKIQFHSIEDAMHYSIQLPNSNVSNKDRMNQKDARNMVDDIKEKLEILESLGESYGHFQNAKYMSKSIKKCLTLLK